MHSRRLEAISVAMALGERDSGGEVLLLSRKVEPTPDAASCERWVTFYINLVGRSNIPDMAYSLSIRVAHTGRNKRETGPW